MSDKTEAPSPEIDDFDIEESKPRPVKAKRKSRLGLYGAAVIALAAGGAMTFNQYGGEELLTSRFAKPPRAMDTTPAGEQLAESERYRNNLRQANLEGAEAATAAPQRSFIAVPDQPVVPNMRDIDDEPKKAKVVRPKLPPANKPIIEPKVEPPKPEVIVKREVVKEIVEQPVYYEYKRDNVQYDNDYSDIDALTRMMQNQASGLGTNKGLSNNQIIIRQDFGIEDDKPVGQNARPALPQKQSSLAIDAGTYGADLSVGADYLVPQERKLPVPSGAMPRNFNPYGFGPGGVFGKTPVVAGGILAKAGDVAYARIVNGTDTDTPGPIIAEITSGDLKGSRLIGSFTENRETTAMIVSFDRVVLETGENIPLSAYAVDAIYGDLAIRSRYNPRFVQRYGPKLAGAFLRGAGAAIAATGTTVVPLGDAVGIASPEASTREAIAAGVSDVGNQLASEIEELGPDRGLVQLYANKPIGVLYLSNVTAPQG